MILRTTSGARIWALQLGICGHSCHHGTTQLRLSTSYSLSTLAPSAVPSHTQDRSNAPGHSWQSSSLMATSLRHKEPGAVCKHKGDRGRLRRCGNELRCHPRSIAKYLLPKTERLQKRTFPTGKSRPASQCTQCHSPGRKLFQGSKCVSR